MDEKQVETPSDLSEHASVKNTSQYEELMILVERETVTRKLKGRQMQPYALGGTIGTVGWNQWYNCAITVCAEISAAAAVIQFWNDTVSPAIWISIILVLIFIFNLIDVGIFGEVEFVFSCVKIVALVGLLILSLVIDLGCGQAPRFLLKCTKRGVPIYCVLATDSLAPLTYMAVSSDSARVFSWFANLVTTAALFTWCSICIAYIGFDRAIRAQGINRKEELAFGGLFQPHLSWASLGFFIIVITFNGFSVFIHGHWDVQRFVVAYVGIPIFFTLFFGWKILKKTKLRSAEEIDLDTGRQLDESTEYE
ncbi:amino acid permease domain-containing protein [Trichoderma novae-zelandiae]